MEIINCRPAPFSKAVDPKPTPVHVGIGVMVDVLVGGGVIVGVPVLVGVGVSVGVGVTVGCSKTVEFETGQMPS